MKNWVYVLFAILIFLPVSSGMATAPPWRVATVFVHGFDPAGSNSGGIVGEDFSLDYALEFAETVGLPYCLTSPTSSNQVAATTYYGEQYPSYYTQADIDEVNAATATYGGGVPRYALIVAKYAREVLRRSGARQINLVGLSFGGLVSRYIIEKDLENLASEGKIARWIGIEGVISGNYAATYGGPLADAFFDQFGGAPVEVEQMKYPWVEANINNPRYTSDCPWLANIPIHFWLAADDNLYGKIVTDLSGKANDGLVLLDDAVLINLPADLLYHDLLPTVSTLHATHESMKYKTELYAGLAADIFGRSRATISLKDVTVKRTFDSDGTGEYVFGVKVTSPEAAMYGVAEPVQDLRAEDNSLPYVNLAVNTTATINLVWFDDMLLPGETELLLDTNVEEIDGSVIYQVTEKSGEQREPLQNAQLMVDVTKGGTYRIETDDWAGLITVDLHKYPAFTGPSGAAAHDWSLYQ